MGSVLRALRGAVRRLADVVGDVGRRLGPQVRRIWEAQLELAEFDARYVAALGTVAAAVFGGELVAEAAIAGVAAVLALLVAVSHQASS